MSDANSNWPFGGSESADGFGDIEKIFSSGSSADAGETNPFDNVPQTQESAQPAPAATEATETKAAPTEPAADPPKESPADEPIQPAPAQEAAAPEKSAPAEDGTANPLATAFSQKAMENAQKGLFEKPPVFCHKNAREPIEDASMTFEELRIRKSEDFADLEEGKNVTWSVEYCGITKQIKDPKGTTIISMKESIERSREFLDALKKAKDKNPDCLVKPKVTMQRKGTASAYRGSFDSVEEARESDKVICMIPACDGRIYEMHKTEQGGFIAPKHKIADFETIKAGFTPALPPIPMSLMGQIIAFFRSFMKENEEYEALALIYWDKEERRFFAYVPKQTVSKDDITADLTDCPYDDGERYIRYADIHSHNSMEAFFSGTDDEDERGTGLYMVLGELDHFFPEIETRIACGNFVNIDPAVVIEGLETEYPEEWGEAVTCIEDKKAKGTAARFLSEALRREI